MDQELDDLFGEDATAAIDLPAVPSPALLQRIDELQTSGCVDKIAWSRVGAVCHITPDNQTVKLSNLRVNRSTGQWEHVSSSDALLDEQLSRIYRGRALAHVSWNPWGLEFVVADVYGRLAVGTNMFLGKPALNRISMVKVWMNEPEDSLNAVVGMTWLHADRPITIPRPAKKNGEHWLFTSTQQKTPGPHNPSTKAAFMLVTRSCHLKAVFHSADGQWQVVKSEIISCSTSADLVTHAAFGAAPGNVVYLALYTLRRQIRLYKVEMRWNPSPGDTQWNQQSENILPNILVTHVRDVDDFSPVIEDTAFHTDLNAGLLATPPKLELQLSHLEVILPSTAPGEIGPDLPQVVAAFSHVNSSGGMMTLLSRWRLVRNLVSLHGSFDKVAPRNSTPVREAKEMITFEKLNDVRLDAVVLVHLQTYFLGSILILAFSNGKVELYDAWSLEPQPRDDLETISGLAQQGFGFVQSNEGSQASVPAAFAMQACIASTNSISASTFDDLLMTHQTFLNDLIRANGLDVSSRHQFESDFVEEIFLAVRASLEFAPDTAAEKVLRHSWIQRWLSVQACVGYRSGLVQTSDDKSGEPSTDPTFESGAFYPRFSTHHQTQTVPSKVASLFLNLRLLSIAFTYAYSSGSAGKGGADGDSSRPSGTSGAEQNKQMLISSRADVLHHMLGLTRWGFALLNYLTDHLLELRREMGPEKNFSPDLIHEHSHIDTGIQIVYKFDPQTYTTEKKERMERDLLVRGIFPTEWESVTERVLCGDWLDKAKEEVNECELYFADFSILEIDDEVATTQSRSKVDALRKIALDESDSGNLVLRPGHTATALGGKAVVKMFRVCTRCCAMIEEVIPKKGTPLWLLQLQRSCLCGGSWMMDD
ncbi:mediator complex subunit [Agyrium rufum]|nr:mediator complex subunit [Agyrium rufum]